MDGLLLPSSTLVKAVQLLIYVEEARTKAQLLFFINDKKKTTTLKAKIRKEKYLKMI